VWGWRHRAGSVDMALHYALIEFIAQHWSWPTLDVIDMGEMNQYPPVSHTVAAVVGRLFGSSILGLHLVSTISAFATYAMLFVLLRFRNPRATLAASAALTAIVAGFESTHAFLGREIVNNFFYPQLFGEMCVFALVLLRSRFALGVASEIAAAVGATFLLGWVYPIAAVQLAGIAVVWRALPMAADWYAHRRLAGRDAISFAVLLVGVAIAIVAHPRFAVVATLASNEGWVIVRVPSALVIPATLLLAALTVALGVLFAQRKLALCAPDAFVALCGGLAGASLAQEAAFYLLGIGSAYGVYKHLFAVSTLLVAAGVVCVVQFTRLGASTAADRRSTLLARLAFAPATLIVLLANDVPWQGEWLPPMVRTEALVRSMMTKHRDAQGHAIVLAGSRIEQFAFSMGIVRLPKDSTHALIYENLSTPEQRQAIVAQTPVTYAFVRPDQVRAPACAVEIDQTAHLAMVTYACQAQGARDASK